MAERSHVLIIDDDPLTRRLYGGWLTKFDIEAVYAADGGEGREMAKKLKPDLVLLDYHLPVMDGLELAHRLKEDEATKNIPIIFLTNEDLTTDAQNALKQIGVEDYLHKSADFPTFQEHLQRFLTIGPAKE